MAWQYIILGVSLLAVAGVLFWGLLSMARGGTPKGGAYNARWSNRIMRYRILLQGIALVVFVVVVLQAAQGG